MSGNFSINVPAYDGEPRRAHRIWLVHKGGKEAACYFWTHPIGAEIRAEVGGELVRSQAGRDTIALFDLAMEWEAQFLEKGWTR